MGRRARARVVALLVAVCGIGAATAADQSLALLPVPRPPASALTGHGADLSCVNSCQSRHDQCRVSTKGAPGCDSDRQRCVESCLVRRQR